MLRLSKQILFALIFVIAAGCSGGGCSTGCSCAGITPLATGFPVESRIENVGSLRLTDSGLTFLEQNLGALAGGVLGGGDVLTFEIPTSSPSVPIVSVEICKNGPKPNANPPECVAEIDIANADLQITTVNPHNVVVSGPLPIRVQKLPLRVDYGLFDENLDIVINGPGTCPGAGKPFKNIGIDGVNVSIEIDGDSSHARFGYSRVRVGNIAINEDDILAGIEYCNGGLTGAIIDALDGFLIGTLTDSIVGTLQSSLEDALCQQANPDLNPPCPTGTNNVDGVCRYGTDAGSECASIILGLDGNIDLGGLLSGFSPGTKGAFNFLFAAGGDSLRTDGSGHHWGDLNPVNQGISLGFYGGTEPTPVSSCVVPANIELPTGIPIPDELTQNSLPNWPDPNGPHFGFALSERFLNYMFAQLYNSGALCLGITADALGGAVPLNTQLIGVGLGAPSLSELGRQKLGAELAIILRPGAPPTVEVGNGTDLATDPLLRIRMNQVAFDFYVFSLDRFVRAFTATMDLEVPMNLMVSEEGLTPVIEELGVNNAVVTNSELIREDADKIATTLQDLLGGLVGSALGGALPAINLNDQLASLGLTLTIPPTMDGAGSPGLRKLTKGDDDFLGIFATLGIAMPQMAMAAPPAPQTRVHTEVEVDSFEVDPEGLRVATWTEDNGPKLRLRVGADLDDGAHALEWQYRVDGMPWHPFRRDRVIDVNDPWIRTMGKHTVQVRARVVGDPLSLDREPAEVTVIVDDEAPKVKLVRTAEGAVEVKVSDLVSAAEDIVVRVRWANDDDGELVWTEWSAWTPSTELAALPADVDAIEVEAMDEDGRVGTAQSELIRGVGDGGAGCQCSLDRQPGESAPRGFWLAGLLGLALLRRRRSERGSRVLRHLFAAGALMLLSGASGCSCGEDTNKPPAKSGCAGRGDCTELTAGLIGAYTSAASSADGTVWVAGYLEANWVDDYRWGDLVVGRLSGETVDWQVVDGVPTDTEVDPEIYDPDGFRGGVTESGDEVGLWTSIAVDAGGSPAVAYYDVTNKALRYASYDGKAWQTATVQQSAGGDVGKYAKLLMVGGQPVIAYLFIEPGEGGVINSGVRLARGSAVGAAAATWAFEDVATSGETACGPGLCPAGTECIVDGRTCAEISGDCAGDCMDECVLKDGAPSCEPVVSASATETYPGAYGLYISMDTAPDGSLGIAFYDRIHGNVVVAQQSGGAWATSIVAGEDAMGNNTTDAGIGCSLDIDDQGNYHIAYVDGLDEALHYVQVQGGTTPMPSERVDDGLQDGDGVHLVGDDADLVVTPSGEVRISYQDATAGTLRYAVGSPNGGAHDWTLTTIAQDGFAGAFSAQVQVDGALRVLNWWRVASPAAEGNVRLVAP